MEKMGLPQGEGALLARVGSALPAEVGDAVPLVVSAELHRLRRGARRAGSGPAPGPALFLSGARRASG